MKSTIQDVAKKAGVSTTTVSRVMNNNYPVKKETRIKVESAIKKLNFRPNILARGLIHKKSNTIGVIVPSITNLFFPTVVKAIEAILREQGYFIYLCNTDNKEDEEIGYINSLQDRQVDGIIVIDPQTKNMKSGLYEKISKEIPLVFINGYNKDVNCNFVINDEESGAIEAMRYLIKSGHKKIAFIRGQKSYSYDLKEIVYKNILNDSVYKKIINIGEGNKDSTVDHTMEIIQRFLLTENRPSAFFCCNDLMALGVINACKKIGLDVPEDMSIIGFDNIITSRLVEPKLTTVDQNMYDLGVNAANMLLKNIENENVDIQRKILTPQLIIRQSTKKIS